MLIRFAAPHSPRFWIALLVAASAATFVAGMTAGANLPRATADGRTVAVSAGGGASVILHGAQARATSAAATSEGSRLSVGDIIAGNDAAWAAYQAATSEGAPPGR